ncbi:MAG: DUF1573 domain-containing protein [Patescibacteria group bacterium]
MSKNKVTILFIIGLIILFLGAVIARGYFMAEQEDAGPKIVITPRGFDFGELKNKKDIVRTAFEVKNGGGETLEIKAVQTSCGCTKASISKKILAPGEAASLEVTYDPSVHSDEKGKILREVYVESNDPAGETIIKIQALIP